MIEQDAQVRPARPPTDGENTEIVSLFAEDARNASLIGLALDYGFDLATVLLVAALVRTSPEAQGPFVKAFIVAGARGRGAALRWLLWLWDTADGPIRDRLAEEHDRCVAGAVMGMHRRVLAGEAISISCWRQARRRFARDLTSSASEAAVEAIVASMWDIGSAPGAIADVAHSWISRTADLDALTSADWAASEHARVTATWNEYGIEYARHNRRQPDESDEAYETRMQEYARDHPLTLSPDDFARWNAWRDHQQRLMQLRTAELRHGLLRILTA